MSVTSVSCDMVRCDCFSHLTLTAKHPLTYLSLFNAELVIAEIQREHFPRTWHPRRHARACRACRACRATFPFSLPRELPDWSAGGLLRCIVLPVYPCSELFSKSHEPDTHELLRTSSRGCHEDATRTLRGNCFRRS